MSQICKITFKQNVPVFFFKKALEEHFNSLSESNYAD